MASEKAREREVHRYYQAWLESSVGYKVSEVQITSTRFHADGSRLKVSKDKAMTSFAQLGCLRLNAKRGIVTLIASVRQYILAEATKTLSLLSDDVDDGDEDELWFGNASLPRSQGISEFALDPEDYTAHGPNGTTRTAPAFVVNDITLDERFSRRVYSGRGVSFYCGVPITSKAGFTIGVYTITDDKPRSGLSPKELRFMRDMASAVMQYLDTVRGEAARFRGERMVLGLSSFIEGRSSVSDSTNGGAPDHPHYKDGDQPSTAAESTKSHRGMNATDADPRILRISESSQQFSTTRGVVSSAVREEKDAEVNPASAAEDKSGTNDVDANQPGTQWSGVLSSKLVLEGPVIDDHIEKGTTAEIDQVFWRAANILRQCAAADGVVFFDAISSNLARRPDTSEFSRAGRRSNAETVVGTSPEPFDDSGDSSSSTSASSGMSDEGGSHVLSSKGQKCRILGYSMDISDQSTAKSNTIENLGLRQQSLRRLIRRYPDGKMFHFNEVGKVTSSEGVPIQVSPRSSDTKAPDETIGLRSRRHFRIAMAQELIRIAPGARSAIWLPLWDFSKQRWCAGAVMWSRRAEQLIAAQDDLSYLRTFGQSIMHELERLDAMISDQIKSTFIANISHEVRTPLHGILGSIELLQGTEIDAFQTCMITAVETCGKTLLDTMEHVLDYAKINQLSKKVSKRKFSVKGSAKPEQIDVDLYNTSSLQGDVDIATIVEEVVETVRAGQTFRHSKLPFSDESLLTHAKSSPDQSSDSIEANIHQRPSTDSRELRLVLDIEHAESWWVNVQPGAIRRVLMNLVGNALKYTDRGFVSVSLSYSKTPPWKPLDRVICLSVKDTGKGMSADFLHNHAFTPFAQESQFSPGAGLGLSIVRQIVNSIGGKIEMQSQKGVGTQVKVWLTLAIVPSPSSWQSPNDNQAQTMPHKTKGMKMCLIDHIHHKAQASERNAYDMNASESMDQAVKRLAESWFGMRTMRSNIVEGVSADVFVYTETPSIDLLLEHHGDYSRDAGVPVIVMASNIFESATLTANCKHHATDLGRIPEIISHPCGPNKFANALYRCLEQAGKVVNHTDRPLDELRCPNVNDESSGHFPRAKGDSEAESLRDGQREGRCHRNRSNDELSSISEHRDNVFSKEIERMKLPSEEERSMAAPAFVEGGPKIVSASDEEEGSETNPSNYSALPNSIGKKKVTRGHTRARTSSDKSTDGGARLISKKARPPILLVDDNEINLSLLKAFMRRSKRHYEAVHNGLEAVHAYERASKHPDTAFTHVLMDISMPVMDGITATRVIRDFERDSALKQPAMVVALTGVASETTQKEMFEAGGDYFMPKPVKFKELMQLLDR